MKNRFNQAEEAYNKREYHIALNLIDEEIKVNPQQIELFIVKGNCLNNLKKYNEAINCYQDSFKHCVFINNEQKMKLAEVGYNACKGLADIEYENHEYKNALKWLQESIHYKPDALMIANIEIVDCYNKLGEYDKALKVIDSLNNHLISSQQVPRLNSFKLETFNGLGIKKIKEELYEDSLKWFNKALDLSSTVDSLLNKADCLNKLSRLDEARVLLERLEKEFELSQIQKKKFLEISFRNNIDLANENVKEYRYENAIKIFELAISNNEDKSYLSNIASCLLKINDFDKAFPCIEKFLLFNPTKKQEADSLFADYYSALGLRELENTNYDEAISFFDHAIKLNARSAFFISKADCLAKLLKYEQVLQTLEEVKQYNPNQEEVNRITKIRINAESQIAIAQKVIKCLEVADNFIQEGSYEEALSLLKYAKQIDYTENKQIDLKIYTTDKEIRETKIIKSKIAEGRHYLLNREYDQAMKLFEEAQALIIEAKKPTQYVEFWIKRAKEAGENFATGESTEEREKKASELLEKAQDIIKQIYKKGEDILGEYSFSKAQDNLEKAVLYDNSTVYRDELKKIQELKEAYRKAESDYISSEHYKEKQEYQKAKELIDEAIKLFRLQKYVEFSQVLDKEIEFLGFINKAKEAYNRNDWETSLSLYESALHIKSDDRASLLYSKKASAFLDLSKERFSDAVEKFKEVLSIQGGDKEAQVGLSESLIKLEKYDEALLYLNPMKGNHENINKLKLEASKGYITKCLNEASYLEAMNVCDKLIKFTEGEVRAEVIANKSMICMKLGQYDEAQKGLEDAVSIVPQREDFKIMLSAVYNMKGEQFLTNSDFSNAKKYFDLALINDRSNVIYKNNLAKILLNENSYERVLDILKVAEEKEYIESEKQIFTSTLTEALKALTKVSKSKDDIKEYYYQLTELHPKNGQYFYEYAKFLVDNNYEAKIYAPLIRQGHNIDPDNQDIIQLAGDQGMDL
jgi:tetratricopeptide (TPR) repeat protein